MTKLPSLITDNFDQLQKLIKIVRNLLEGEQTNIIKIFSTLHPATAASILQFLTNNEREEVIAILGHNFDPEILSYLDESVRETVLDLWAIHEVAQKLEQLDEQDAIQILEELNKEERRALLRALKPEIRVFIEESLSYPDDSAGRLMQAQVVAIPLEWNVEKVRSFLANASNLPEDLEEIFVVNKERTPIAKVHISKFLTHNSQESISKICTELECVFTATTNEKDVFFKFRTFGLKSAPVVDSNNKLIGVILISDIIDLLYQEAQEDFLHSGGLEESDFYANFLKTSAARLKWLSVSIFGSFAVALTVSSFQDVIAKKTQLVALLTIVMNISSVSGVQVVTVIIRALINRELNIINARRTFIKEMIVAMINGLILGIFFGLIFGIKTMDFRYPILILSSITISMVFGAITGTLLPIVFNKFGIDPALSSGALLSCTIDAFSTLVFLMIAKGIFL